MSLLTEFREWQEKLIILQQEGERLYARIEELENQNAELRQALAAGEMGEGFQALTGLYDEGYHICPNDFGKERDDECLFCLNFLLHKGPTRR